MFCFVVCFASLCVVGNISCLLMMLGYGETVGSGREANGLRMLRFYLTSIERSAMRG